jgi:glycosyltransferase involved in cell wall biosynthesis
MISNNGFSIIVCTYNGNRTLAKVFSHIKLLSTINFNFELIIVDNKSNSESKYLINNLIKEYNSIDIIYLEEIKIGKTHALIKGFEYANYDYIVISFYKRCLN